VDKTAKFNTSQKGRETNYVEVLTDSAAVADFVNQFNPDLDKEDSEQL
jgi:hypothetical protein